MNWLFAEAGFWDAAGIGGGIIAMIAAVLAGLQAKSAKVNAIAADRQAKAAEHQVELAKAQAEAAKEQNRIAMLAVAEQQRANEVRCEVSAAIENELGDKVVRVVVYIVNTGMRDARLQSVYAEMGQRGVLSDGEMDGDIEPAEAYTNHLPTTLKAGHTAMFRFSPFLVDGGIDVRQGKPVLNTTSRDNWKAVQGIYVEISGKQYEVPDTGWKAAIATM